MMSRANAIVMNVITSVATADKVDPDELDPLYEYIDPDVLERLYEQGGADWSFTFQYLDHQVTVAHDGQLMIDGVTYTSDVLTK